MKALIKQITYRQYFSPESIVDLKIKQARSGEKEEILSEIYLDSTYSNTLYQGVEVYILQYL